MSIYKIWLDEQETPQAMPNGKGSVYSSSMGAYWQKNLQQVLAKEKKINKNEDYIIDKFNEIFEFTKEYDLQNVTTFDGINNRVLSSFKFKNINCPVLKMISAGSGETGFYIQLESAEGKKYHNEQKNWNYGNSSNEYYYNYFYFGYYEGGAFLCFPNTRSRGEAYFSSLYQLQNGIYKNCVFYAYVGPEPGGLDTTTTERLYVFFSSKTNDGYYIKQRNYFTINNSTLNNHLQLDQLYTYLYTFFGIYRQNGGQTTLYDIFGIEENKNVYNAQGEFIEVQKVIAYYMPIFNGLILRIGEKGEIKNAVVN